MPVPDAVGLVCGGAEAGLSVCLIFRVVSLEPDYLAVTLKRKHMCGDTALVALGIQTGNDLFPYCLCTSVILLNDINTIPDASNRVYADKLNVFRGFLS